MDLPDFPVVSEDTARLISEIHGLGATTFARIPSIGVFNQVFRLGEDLILRVPRNDVLFISALAKEALAVQAARAAGVTTPRLVAFDDSLGLLPVPYAVYERVEGQPLELLGLDPAATPGPYRALGRDLARLHLGVRREGRIGALGAPYLPLDDPRELPQELAAAGYFSAFEARWLEGWLERMPPLLQSPDTDRFLHGDTQATNVLVRRDSLEYVALIDWGGCGWGDPAIDFSGMPLRAVPDVLAGYREIAPLPDDETAERRILRYHLHLALAWLRGEPRPLHSWGERPLSYWLDLMHFLLEPQDARPFDDGGKLRSRYWPW
jgi:aminoglycoside phosphotransferase (APT) family kinase protein